VAGLGFYVTWHHREVFLVEEHVVVEDLMPWSRAAWFTLALVRAIIERSDALARGTTGVENYP